jgi:hypothetical protein
LSASEVIEPILMPHVAADRQAVGLPELRLEGIARAAQRHVGRVRRVEEEYPRHGDDDRPDQGLGRMARHRGYSGRQAS